jgi:phosphoglycerate dehydrogenase-like enzyme
MDIYVSTWLTPDLLNLSPRLKWAQLLTAGVDFLENVDIDPQLKITTASGIASKGVAEHAVGLMIALDRRLDLSILRQRKWTWRQDGIVENIRGLSDRTVGIIGLGNVGRAIANLVKAMGMTAIGMSRHYQSIEGIDVLYGQNDILELLRRADFVILSLPLTKETRGIISQKELIALGKDSYLINVARGELVNESDLAFALKKGIIHGAALDVLSKEPPSRRNPLRGCPNLIITPHIAGNIYTFRHDIRKRFVRNLKAFLNGDELEGLYLLSGGGC